MVKIVREADAGSVAAVAKSHGRNKQTPYPNPQWVQDSNTTPDNTEVRDDTPSFAVGR